MAEGVGLAPDAARLAIREGTMSIFRRVSFLGLALASLVVLAACGGDGDGGGGGEAFERPAPGEYVFDVEATIEFTLTEPAVSAAAGVLQTILAWEPAPPQSM